MRRARAEPGYRAWGSWSITGVAWQRWRTCLVAWRHCAITAKNAASARGSPGMAPWEGASGVGPPRTTIQAVLMSSVSSVV
eukprot:11211014-Lingulodinium_polyedra.AAC.1